MNGWLDWLAPAVKPTVEAMKPVVDPLVVAGTATAEQIAQKERERIAAEARDEVKTQFGTIWLIAGIVLGAWYLLRK